MSEDSSDLDSDEEEYEEPLYFGKRSAAGLPHGRGTLKWARSGNRFEGRFVDGCKEGKGCFYFADGSTLSGSYNGGKLAGETLYTHADGSCMVADYCNGEMEGPFKEYLSNGSVSVAGAHSKGRRSGILWIFDEYGGTLVGLLDKNGQLTGNDIAYVYPDKTTALIGQFEDRQLVKAQAAKLDVPLNDGELNNKAPKFSCRDDFPDIISIDVSTHEKLSSQPLLSDVYEKDRVCVKRSLIENADEGLFAKVDLQEDEVVSFYNGIRLSHDEVDSRDWSLNGNTLSLDEDVVIDIPLESASTEIYCATLGHKANHSKHPNCKYDLFYHPRYIIL